MRFTTFQLLCAVAAIGAGIGIAVRDGLSVACTLVALVYLCVFCAIRAQRRWAASNPFQKFYAATTVVASGILLRVSIYWIGTSASLARQRNLRQLQVWLEQEPRCSQVQVKYSEGKIEALWVDGTVSSEHDFQSLRKHLSRYDWRKIEGVHWDIAVAESCQSHDG